jgi:hypothetical protein
MTTATPEFVRVNGRQLTDTDLIIIRELLAKNAGLTRTALSRHVCDALSWFRPNGQRQEMSCRAALRKLEQMGLVQLPAPVQANGNGNWRPRLTQASAPGQAIVAPAPSLAPLTLMIVASRAQAQLWNELIARYHYLGYRPLAGAQLRYLIYCQQGLVGALSFSAAAWKIAPRDHWIGWSDEQRRRHLALLVGNSRFLILPWVQSPNLASKILSLAARQLRHDWQQRHGYQPVLLETFVETKRFHGTCYKAANWIYVGQTQGRGRMDRWSQNFLPVKAIYVYPLCADFRHHLCTSREEMAR